MVLSEDDHMEVWQQMIVWDVSPQLCLAVTSGILHLCISTCGLLAELKMADDSDHIIELKLPRLVIVEFE